LCSESLSSFWLYCSTFSLCVSDAFSRIFFISCALSPLKTTLGVATDQVLLPLPESDLSRGQRRDKLALGESYATGLAGLDLHKQPSGPAQAK
jgi:hypothetical protein